MDYDYLLGAYNRLTDVSNKAREQREIAHARWWAGVGKRRASDERWNVTDEYLTTLQAFHRTMKADRALFTVRSLAWDKRWHHNNSF